MVMNPETKIETKAVKWLKEMGCYVFKLAPGPGVPVGAPDRGFFYRDKWGVIEFKRDAKAPYRTGQKETLKWLGKYNPHVYTVYPENWLEVREKLIATFF